MKKWDLIEPQDICEFSNSLLVLPLEGLWLRIDKTHEEGRVFFFFVKTLYRMGEDKQHALKIFLKEALVKPAEGGMVVMVKLETCTPAGTRISSLTFLAPDEILVLVLLSLNSLPTMPSFMLCSWGHLLSDNRGG